MSDDPSLEVVGFLSRHQRLIAGAAYAATNDFHLADDVVQEVALIVAREWARVPRDGGATPWLREVVRRKALELMRRQRRARGLSVEAVAAVIAALPEDEPDHADLRERLSRCLHRLRGAAREVVDARYRQGLSCEAVAERLGRPVPTIYTILRRARQALLDCMERQGDAA